MYVYYAEEEAEAEMHHRRASLSGPERTFRRARKAYLVLLCACGFAFGIMIVSAVVSHRFPWLSQAWADILGVAVAVLACIQWVPQALTTWHLGHLGSLSLASLCLSAPVGSLRLQFLSPLPNLAPVCWVRNLPVGDEHVCFGVWWTRDWLT